MAAINPSRLTLGELLGDQVAPEHRGVAIGGLSLDSTRIRPGEAFLACAGSRGHGLDHAAQAVRAGAAAIVYEPRGGATETLLQRVPCVRVDGLRRAAGQIAARFYGEPSTRIRVAGITGTNGKTTVARLVAGAAEQAGLVCGVSGTLGYGRPGRLEPTDLTTPDAVEVQRRLAQLADHGVTHVAMEVSSHALDQHRVGGVHFDAAVFTNLSRDHLDYHGDMASYLASKQRLFGWPQLRGAVINVDDAAGASLARELADTVALTAVGRRDAVRGFNAVTIAAVDATPAGIRLAVTTPRGDVGIDSPMLGDFNATNLALALAVLLDWELEPGVAAAALGQVAAAPGRMEAFGGGAAPLVVVDYAHTPDALENALRALRRHCERELWVVFGCGGGRDRGKRPLMGEIAARLADRVVITDDNPRDENPLRIIDAIRSGIVAGAHVQVAPGRRDAIERTIAAAAPGDVVLLAGKGHEEYQLVGGRRLPLSDRDAARRLVGERA